MTLPYTWNPMPHQVTVRCPSCIGRATFEFATTRKISLKKDVQFFQGHHSLEYFLSTDSCGHKYHVAAYYPQLHGGKFESIGDLPDGYSPKNWEPSQYWSRTNASWGSFLCKVCHHRSKGNLDWPSQAYYQIEYKGDVLWAFNRDSLRALRDYIESDLRDINAHEWKSFLMKVPTKFLRANARSKVVRSLDKIGK